MRLVTFPCLAALCASVAAYDNIIAFADSLTDNGNDFKYRKFPPSPPYFKGRFSNGPTWLETVAKNLRNTPVINRGFGGATSNGNFVHAEFNNFTVPGLKQDIEDYPVPVIKPLTKEIIANNIIDGIKAIEKKYHGRYFLLASVPPVDKFPIITSSERSKTKELVDSYNKLLVSKLNQLSGLDIKIIDIHGWFESMIANPKPLGLLTDNGPCIPGIGNTDECPDPTKHFFWDSYHPDAKVHKALGEWATHQIQELFP